MHVAPGHISKTRIRTCARWSFLLHYIFGLHVFRLFLLLRSHLLFLCDMSSSESPGICCPRPLEAAPPTIPRDSDENKTYVKLMYLHLLVKIKNSEMLFYYFKFFFLGILLVRCVFTIKTNQSD